MKTYSIIVALLVFLSCDIPSLIAQDVTENVKGNTIHIEEKQSDVALNTYVVGAIYEHKEEYRRAITAYETALLFDGDAAIHRAIARCAVAAGDRILAISHLGQAASKDSTRFDPLRQLGELYMDAGKADSAAITFETLVAHDSSDQRTRTVLGRIYEQWDTVRAIAVYTDIMRRGAENEVAYRLANLYNLTDRVDSATAALEDLRSVEGDSEYLLQTMAGLFMRQFAFPRAAVLYDTLRQRHPEKPSYALFLAEALMNQDNWIAASDLLYPLASDTAIGQEDRLQIGKLYFQKALRERLDIDRALAVFDALHASFPEDWRPLWFRGAVLFNEGATHESISAFREALKLDPGNPDLQRTLDQLTQQQ